MIPVLLGSTRIPDKNLLYVDGYPMAHYVVDACREAGVFDKICINFEDNDMRLAGWLGVGSFHLGPGAGGSRCVMKSKSRDCEGTRCQTPDHYLYSFMQSVRPDVLVQAHATSPLVRPGTIRTLAERIHDVNGGTW